MVLHTSLVNPVCLILAAVEFLRCVPEGKYDGIIVDSSDPVGMSLYIDFSNKFSQAYLSLEKWEFTEQ